MDKRLPLWLMLFAIGALATLRAQAPAAPAAMPAGQIVAAKVQGVVTVTVNGATAAVTLKPGDPVPEHATVNTSRDSSVVLVFSNGATTQLGAETQLAIDQFVQDPFAGNLAVADLTEEPTTSKTKLHLTRGELVGNVKHLKQDKGSTFVIDTPVGAAGIRGTTFRIVFRPDSTGLAFSFSLSTVEGNVNFQQGGTGGTGTGTGGTGTGTGTGGGTVGTGGVAVPTGQEVVVTVNVETNPVTGAVTVSTPVVVTNTTSISSTTMQALVAQASTSATAAAAVTFTPGGTGSGTGSGTGGTGTGTSGDGTGTGSKFTGTGTTSGATSTGTDLTPGDGTVVH